MPTTKIPSASQTLVLSAAADRPDGALLPLPPTLRARGVSRQSLLDTLLKAGLVAEQTAAADAPCWREGDGVSWALHITLDGYAAIGRTAPEVAAPEPQAAPARPAGKLGTVLDHIGQGAGATLAELTALTGWLPHTTRAAITGLRQRGFPVHLADQDGRKAYRLTGAG